MNLTLESVVVKHSPDVGARPVKVAGVLVGHARGHGNKMGLWSYTTIDGVETYHKGFNALREEALRDHKASLRKADLRAKPVLRRMPEHSEAFEMGYYGYINHQAGMSECPFDERTLKHEWIRGRNQGIQEEK